MHKGIKSFSMTGNNPIDQIPPLIKLVGFIILAIIMSIASFSVGYGALWLLFDIDLSNTDLINNYSDPDSIRNLKVIQLANSIGTFVLPPFFFVWLIRANPAEYLRLNTKTAPINFLLAAVMMIAAMPLINWMVGINEQMVLPEALSGIENWMRESEIKAKELTEAFLFMDGPGDLLINIGLVALIPALGEELFFRGVVQRLCIRGFANKHIGIWATAFLFSAIHMQFFGFFPRMILGAALGYAFAWSGTLWVPIVAHFINNAGAVIVSYLIGNGTISPDIESIGANGTQEILLVAGSLIVVAATMVGFHRFSPDRLVRPA